MGEGGLSVWRLPHGLAARRAPPLPWAPWSSPGNDPDVKAGLTPGVHEGKQPPLEVGQAVHVALCEVHLVLQEQGHTHLRGDTPSGRGSVTAKTQTHFQPSTGSGQDVSAKGPRGQSVQLASSGELRGPAACLKAS